MTEQIQGAQPAPEHTPGPWKARIQTSKEGRDLGWIIEHPNGRIGWASLSYADTNKEAGADDPAREANARLIAAAPELLEIVRISIGNVRSLGPAGAMAQVHTPYREWLAQLEDAYTKVTGERA